MTLKTYTHMPSSGEKPKSMVIMLHGLGANGADLIGLARYWEDALPGTMFLSPDAPFPCDMAPVGFQWFSLLDRSPHALQKGVWNAAPIVEHYAEEMLNHYDIPLERLALMGFSQGTMMSLYVAPRLSRKIAGVLGYSGMLAGWEKLDDDPALHKIPIHLIHGDMDSVLPVSCYHAARETLESHGFPVTGSVTRGLEHSIDESGIESGATFLRNILCNQPPA